MKKKILIGVLVLTLLVGAFAVYADSPDTNEFDRGYGYTEGNGYGHMNDRRYNQDNRRVKPTDDKQWSENSRGFCGDQRNFTEEEREEWFQQTQKERSERREECIKRDLENGIINQEEADRFRSDFTEREKSQEKNGYRDGICNDSGGRKGRGNNNKREQGHGNGMMGGQNY